MSKRLQIFLSAEAEAKLETIFNEVTSGFKTGTIKISDVISEMILSSDIDIKEIRIKYTDLKKSLIELAHADNIDVDMVIKSLQELKNKNLKSKNKVAKLNEV